MSHNQNPVSKWSTRKEARRRPQLFMVGIAPYYPSSTRVLIAAQMLESIRRHGEQKPASSPDPVLSNLGKGFKHGIGRTPLPA